MPYFMVAGDLQTIPVNVESFYQRTTMLMNENKKRVVRMSG